MFARRESLKEYFRLYPVTALLIIVNIVVWGVMEVYSFGQDPSITRLQFGAIFDLPNMKAETWRYVTAMFIHIGFEHLFFNSFALYVFAPPLERMLGKWRYLLTYIVSGITGNIFSMWLHKDYFVSAGASGAIYGIYAAFLFLAIFRKDIIDQYTKKTILVIVGVGFASSLIIPRIDIYAHLGGFVGGIVTMALIVLSIKRRHRRQ
ncbi:Membrane associated serine protease, rhomboid family [Paenibacillus sp. 1_12]|uniref:rhomboid family intramembrane serine protease n=1 Tax=Paenibacillus sp. 1_12 TaxID=1566278 RepID=UPI0008E4C305|nr:rhomboid family intramembrane serine protease [Paenibacillus sp. 1_12]SFL07925.1 Membrane associated serine protease, rhomboid family [Paenibacillus sp. 1_12]